MFYAIWYTCSDYDLEKMGVFSTCFDEFKIIYISFIYNRKKLEACMHLSSIIIFFAKHNLLDIAVCSWESFWCLVLNIICFWCYALRISCLQTRAFRCFLHMHLPLSSWCRDNTSVYIYSSCLRNLRSDTLLKWNLLCTNFRICILKKMMHNGYC